MDTKRELTYAAKQVIADVLLVAEWRLAGSDAYVYIADWVEEWFVEWGWKAPPVFKQGDRNGCKGTDVVV